MRTLFERGWPWLFLAISIAGVLKFRAGRKLKSVAYAMFGAGHILVGLSLLVIFAPADPYSLFQTLFVVPALLGLLLQLKYYPGRNLEERSFTTYLVRRFGPLRVILGLITVDREAIRMAATGGIARLRNWKVKRFAGVAIHHWRLVTGLALCALAHYAVARDLVIFLGELGVLACYLMLVLLAGFLISRSAS